MVEGSLGTIKLQVTISRGPSSNLTLRCRKEIFMATAKRFIPENYHTVTPSLGFDNAKEAIDWYKKALGAAEVSRHLMPDGQVAHAELRIGNSTLMLHDAMMGQKGPKAHGGSPCSFYLYVEDCDALYDRALKAGGKVVMPLSDQFWGDRCGTFEDPHGYSWSIATHKEDLSPGELEKRQAEWMANAAPAS
jgi:PhnB protein